jgi:hypothetical protein
MWNYLIPLITSALALMQILKDWDAHKAPWRRGVVVGAIALLGIGGMVNAYRSGQSANEQASKIVSLTTAVETANKAQVENTKVFTGALGDFSTKLNKLETNVKTAGLREEADQLRVELAKTQKALTSPRAILKSGIVDSGSEDVRNFTHLMVPLGKPVSFDIDIQNFGAVAAHSGYLAVRLCDVCKFHSEPPGFTHPRGQPENERTLDFEHIMPATRVQTITLEVDLPDNFSSFIFLLRTVCENCLDSGFQRQTVGVTRLGIRPAQVKPH